MNLQQLRCVREVIRQEFNLTQAANALFTSQPGVSKVIIDFEDELGFDLFVRHGKRIKGLTPEGERLVPFMDAVLNGMVNLREAAFECKNPSQGRLTIATTHTQARYALPAVIAPFRERYPQVRLSLLQGAPPQIAQMVLSGQADIAVATEAIAHTDGLTATACYEWQHHILLPKNHPLTHAPLTVTTLAAYPIVTYDPAFAGRGKIDAAFAAAQVVPDIVLEAIDADVIRTYVEVGLGVGILAGMALAHMPPDGELLALDAGELFGVNTTYAAMRTDRYVREYERFFIELLQHTSIKEAL
ncbi:MAG: LysR substrate-binding domain-containing protein [Formosimonas sp.]